MAGKTLRTVPLFVALLILLTILLPSQAVLAESGALSTIYASDNQFAGNMFDVEVLSDSDIRLDSFDINATHQSVTDLDVSVYYKEGSYRGFESDSSAWTLLGTANITPRGEDVPTPVPIGGLRLISGKTYGFYVLIDNDRGGFLHYTNGSATYQDANLRIISGIGTGPGFGSNINENRIWNGTIYYSKISVVPSIPATGDASGTHLLFMGSLAFLSLSGLVFMILNRARKKAHL